MCCRVALTLPAGRKLKNGDWLIATSKPCRSVSVNTGSSVWLAKSASTTVSFSVSAWARYLYTNVPATTPTRITAAQENATHTRRGWRGKSTEVFALGGVTTGGLAVSDGLGLTSGAMKR